MIHTIPTFLLVVAGAHVESVGNPYPVAEPLPNGTAETMPNENYHSMTNSSEFDSVVYIILDAQQLPK